jgi:hypothetical protein
MVECNRTMEQARRDYASGLLSGVTLVRVPMQPQAWNVRLAGKRGDNGMLLDVATLQPLVFEKLDLAVKAIEQIGFRCDVLRIG